MANNLPPPKIAILERVIWSAGPRKSLSVRSGGAGFDRFRLGARNCPFDTSHLVVHTGAVPGWRYHCPTQFRNLTLDGAAAQRLCHRDVSSGVVPDIGSTAMAKTDRSNRPKLHFVHSRTSDDTAMRTGAWTRRSFSMPHSTPPGLFSATEPQFQRPRPAADPPDAG
jgi:hypothetical protein